MPLPTPPTILLAAGGLAMVVGRSLPARFSQVWRWYYLISLILAACSLWWDPISLASTIKTFDIRRVWINDGLAAAEQWVVLLFGLLTGVAFFDRPTNTRSHGNLYGFLLFVVSSLMLVARANDFLSLGMSLEIGSIAVLALNRVFDSSTPLTSAPTDVNTEQQGLSSSQQPLRWLLACMLWLGIALLANAVMTTQFDAIRLILTEVRHGSDAQHAQGPPAKLVLLATGLILLTLVGRMGLVPFHLGLSVCPANRSIWSWSVTVVCGQLAGSIALSRLCGRVLVGLGPSLFVQMTVVCLSSFFLAAVICIRGFVPGVRSIPRWLTSFSLLQSAWLAVAFIVATLELDQPGARWGAFPQQQETLGILVFAQITALLSLLGIAGLLAHLARIDRGIDFLEDVKGLSQITPGTAIALMVLIASFIGLPWTAGFWGRWLTMLSGDNVHLKSSSSVFDPNEGVRFVILAGSLATIVIASSVVRLFREMFLELPLSRPVSIGGRGLWYVGCVCALTTLLLGIAPQLLLDPLRTIEVPRQTVPQRELNGSGKNPSVFRTRFKTFIELFESSCQARYDSQVDDHFLISTKLSCCTWQSTKSSAQFCPVWSGTALPDHQPCEDNPFILTDPYS